MMANQIKMRRAASRAVMSAALTMLALLFLTNPSSASDAEWGKDFATGAAKPFIDEIRAELVALVKAPDSERDAKIDAFIAARAASHIEAIKRFRNPELRPLFIKLLNSEDWRLRHRALYALEKYDDPSYLDRTIELIVDPEPRMREKAIITLIKRWDERAIYDAGAAQKKIQEQLASEESLHIRRCLLALQQRIAGKLKPQVAHEEYVRKDPDGLWIVPVIDGLGSATQEAPGYVKKSDMKNGGSSAEKLPVAESWTTPLLMWGIEEAKGATLQPFANPRENGMVHTGQDVGASLEGAGFYACADGVVRMVHTGSDMGTLIVLEHHYQSGELVSSVYMHGGDTVFVAAGDEVVCGQLLTTEGLGFSIENGGHYAHLHHGLYPGPFVVTHNYGYKKAADGLGDWFDPAEFIVEWMERTEPLMPELRGLAPELDKAMAQLEKGKYAKAFELATEVKDSGDAVPARDAERVLEALGGAPARLEARARAELARGYPKSAMQMLETGDKQLAGVPGSEAIDLLIKTWKKDEAFKQALKGEAEIEALQAQVARLKQKEKDKGRQMWSALLERYRGTALEERINTLMERSGS